MCTVSIVKFVHKGIIQVSVSYKASFYIKPFKGASSSSIIKNYSDMLIAKNSINESPSVHIPDGFCHIFLVEIQVAFHRHCFLLMPFCCRDCILLIFDPSGLYLITYKPLHFITGPSCTPSSHLYQLIS